MLQAIFTAGNTTLTVFSNSFRAVVYGAILYSLDSFQPTPVALPDNLPAVAETFELAIYTPPLSYEELLELFRQQALIWEQYLQETGGVYLFESVFIVTAGFVLAYLSVPYCLAIVFKGFSMLYTRIFNIFTASRCKVTSSTTELVLWSKTRDIEKTAGTLEIHAAFLRLPALNYESPLTAVARASLQQPHDSVESAGTSGNFVGNENDLFHRKGNVESAQSFISKTRFVPAFDLESAQPTPLQDYQRNLFVANALVPWHFLLVIALLQSLNNADSWNSCEIDASERITEFFDEETSAAEQVEKSDDEHEPEQEPEPLAIPDKVVDEEQKSTTEDVSFPIETPNSPGIRSILKSQDKAQTANKVRKTVRFSSNLEEILNPGKRDKLKAGFKSIKAKFSASSNLEQTSDKKATPHPAGAAKTPAIRSILKPQNADNAQSTATTEKVRKTVRFSSNLEEVLNPGKRDKLKAGFKSIKAKFSASSNLEQTPEKKVTSHPVGAAKPPAIRSILKPQNAGNAQSNATTKKVRKTVRFNSNLEEVLNPGKRDKLKAGFGSIKAKFSCGKKAVKSLFHKGPETEADDATLA